MRSVLDFVDRRWWVGPVIEKRNLEAIVAGEEEGSELGFVRLQSG